MSLQDPLNKIRLIGHVGPHGIYNMVVYDRLINNVVSKFAYGSDAYRRALRIELAFMRGELRDSTSLLGSLVRARAGGVERTMYGNMGRAIANGMGL
jgi:hypothetical protein